MARTPSFGLDQNQDGKFIDKYYGRMPWFLHAIPESNIWVCNPEYIVLLAMYLEGDIPRKNLSIELYDDIEYVLSFWGQHYSVVPKEIVVVLQCLEEYLDEKNPIPPGSGSDDADCLILHVYNPDTSVWDRWQTSNDLQFILNYSDTRRCIPGGVIPDNDCYGVTVADEATTQPLTLIMNGNPYHMSVTYGSCEDIIKFGKDCSHGGCPSCLGLNVYDDVHSVMKRVNLDGEYVYVSDTFESCASIPSVDFGKDCDGDCPPCLATYVYHPSSKTKRRLILDSENSFVSDEPGTCGITFGKQCDDDCPPCLFFHVYDDVSRKMKQLTLDDKNLLISDEFETCTQITNPTFGKDCDEDCPDCLSTYVYNGHTNTMDKLYLDGQYSYISNEPGLCTALPDPDIIWGNECTEICTDCDCYCECPDCMSLHVYNPECNEMQKVIMEDNGVNVGSTFESCALLPEPPVFGPDPEPGCVGDECPDCMPVNVYNGFKNTMDRLLFNDGNGFDVGRDFESCVSEPIIIDPNPTPGPGPIPDPDPDIVFGKECEGSCPLCMGLHVYHIASDKMERIVMEGNGVSVGRAYESCADALIVDPVPGPTPGPDPEPDPTPEIPIDPATKCQGFTVFDPLLGSNIAVSTDDDMYHVSVSKDACIPLIYYADEADSTVDNPNGTNSRVLGMDPVSMSLINEIKLRPYSHAGSCDRAGYTDRMYVRTATTHYGSSRYLGIVSLSSGQWIGEIPLNYKPRSSGAFNKFKNVHAISTKENPWLHIINVETDSVIFSAGRDGGSPHGNDGGNATGHSIWLDPHHVALLDRHFPSFEIYNVAGAEFPFTVTHTQQVVLPTGCHSLRPFNMDIAAGDTEFFAAIEGESGTGVHPEMKKYTFDDATGELTEVGSIEFFSYIGSNGDNDSIHHFGCGMYNGKKIIVVPLSKSNRVFVIDVATWTLDSTLVPATGYYTVGVGAVSAGHADFCNAGGLNVVVITNHKSKTVSIIDLDSKTSSEVDIPSLASYVNGTDFSQSHANHVIGIHYYFFEAVNGIFYEINLVTKVITRSVQTGGKPVQSFS